MAIALYMDHNIDRAVTDGLRLRGVDVLTAYQDGTQEADDPDLLDRATALGRVLFSTDSDLLVEARRRQGPVSPSRVSSSPANRASASEPRSTTWS